jgi:hypothetical protein
MMLVDWMESHAEEIDGLEKQLALVMQLDRLSNKQLIEIMSAADPLAKSAVGRNYRGCIPRDLADGEKAHCRSLSIWVRPVRLSVI